MLGLDTLSIDYQARTKLLDLAVEVASSINDKAVQDKLHKAIQIRYTLKGLEHKALMDATCVDKIYLCLMSKAEINSFPVAPILDPAPTQTVICNLVECTGDGSGTSYTFANGLTLSGSEARLGGTLTLDTIFTDSRATKKGLEYAADYTSGFVSLSIPHKGYVDSHLGGKSTSAIVSAPTITQDGFVVYWDNTAGTYSLKESGTVNTTGNLTESISSILTITGGTNAVLGTGTSIQVSQASTTTSGFISSADWNTFNSKLSNTLTSGKVLVGNISNVATEQTISGDITLSNTGVAAIGAGVIVNADVSATAGIATTKLAALTASRAVSTNASGFLEASATTSTELGYVSGVTSPIQTQLNTKLPVTLTGTAAGDIIYYNGVNWVNLGIGAPAQILKVSGGLPVWQNENTPPGVPAGGTAGQYLSKIDATNYNTEWTSLTLSKVTDVTATAAEVNILDGATLTTTELNYVDGATSNLQTQINNKQEIIIGGASTITTADLIASRALMSDVNGKVAVSDTTSTELSYLNNVTGDLQSQLDSKLPTTLTNGSILIGNASNVATAQSVTGDVVISNTGVTSISAGVIVNADINASAAIAVSKLAAGTNGYVIKTVAGVPTWAAEGTGITNTAANNELMKSDGTNAVPSGLSSATLGNLTLGTGATSGDRTINVWSSSANAALSLNSQGTSAVLIKSGKFQFLDSQLTMTSDINRISCNHATNFTIHSSSKLTLNSAISATASSGSDLEITAGGNTSTGNGGNLILNPGDATGGGTDGYIKMSLLPTADPGVVGAIWNDLGTLKISI